MGPEVDIMLDVIVKKGRYVDGSATTSMQVVLRPPPSLNRVLYVLSSGPQRLIASQVRREAET